MRRFIDSLKVRGRNRRGRFDPHRRRPYGFEQLEGRYLLTAVSWTGLGDHTSWTDTHNWSTVTQLPGAGDDVTISISGSPTIQLASGTQSIQSLATTNLLKLTGGTLQIGTTAQIGANLMLAGGTILGGTINEIGGAVIALSTSGGKLDGVTVNGSIDAATQSGKMTVYDGLTLNGTLSLGNVSGSTSGQILFGDSTHAAGSLAGTGAIVFGASAGNSINNDSNLGGASGTLTLGPNITIHGKSGSIVNDFATGSLVSQGAINADTSGGTILLGSANGSVSNQGAIQVSNGASLTISDLVNQSGATATATGSTLTLGGSLSNLGTITATNSTVNLAGSFSQANLGTFTRSGGTVNVTDTILGDVTLDANTGSWNLSGGNLQGGNVNETGGASLSFTASGAILDNKTINGDLDLTLQGYFYVLGSLTLNGTLMLGNASGTTHGMVYFGTGTQRIYGNEIAVGNATLEGNATVVFGGSNSDSLVNNTLVDGSASDPLAIVIGQPNDGDNYAVGGEFNIYPNVTIRGGGPGFNGGAPGIFNDYSEGSIVNYGTIDADGAAHTLAFGNPVYLGVQQNFFLNFGTLEATNGGSVAVGGLVNFGSVQASGGSGLTLTGSLENDSTITVTNSAVNLNGSNFTQAQLGNFSRPGSTVGLSGTLTGGLTLNAATGSWNLMAGTILGGTLAESGGAELVFTNFGGTLNGVTVNGDMDLTAVNAHAIIVNNLVLNGTMYIGDLLGNPAGVQFGDPTHAAGSLTGSGTVTFGTRNNNYINNDGSGILTIGAGITIHGKIGEIYNNTAAQSILNLGTIDADVSGGSILVAPGIGSVTNQGLIEATNGDSVTISNLTNKLGKTVSANGGTVTLNGNWTNAGIITTSNNATLNLGGAFTRAGLGAFLRSGGTVNLTGTLTGGLPLDAGTGSWNLMGGTIQGGRVDESGGSVLALTSSGGTLSGVTINGDVDGTQQIGATLTIVGGLVLNGSMSLGNASGSTYASVNFATLNTTAGSLTGNGTVIFGGYPSNSVRNFSNLSGAAGTLTIGPDITLRGKGGGLVNIGGANSTILNQGKIYADTAGGAIIIGEGGTFLNQGLMQANNGTFRLGVFPITGSFNLSGTGVLGSNWSGGLEMSENFLGSGTGSAGSDPRGSATFDGTSSAAAPQLLEVMSNDLGDTAAGFSHNFVYGKLTQATGFLRLVDQSHNSGGTGPEALYVNSLIVASLDTLDLNGLHLYVRAAQISGTVINGTISQLPDGGPLDLNSPLPGAISPAGNVDTWTFFGRAGEVITTYVNPGTGSAPVPILPSLNWAGVQLLDPDNQVLATGASANIGTAVSLINITLPVDGTYSIKINAASGHSSSTGNYVVAAFDVTPRIAPLVLSQTEVGSINTPFDVQQWTFTALAGEQVRFHLINKTSAGLVYSLTGPNGLIGFSNLTGDSPLVSLPVSGVYTLSALGQNGATGNYSFVVNPTTQTDLPLNGSINGTIAGAGQAELFRIAVPSVQTLQLLLNDNSQNDVNELYMKFGSPPTRETYDYRYSSASAANQTILVPSAAIGTWYVLLYSSKTPAPSTFSLSVNGYNLRLAGSTPSTLGNSAPASLSITGAGFEPGTAVTLMGPGNTQYAAASTSVVSFTQLTATFAAGLPPGVYSVVVTHGADTDSLQNAFTVTAGGSAKLETNLQVPNFLGRHIPATIYITYANAGTVAMPAPLLVLGSTDPAERPLLTLDPTKITQGLYTATLPEGYSNTIQILASGQIPGVLLPGESITVPVYYAGLQQPWSGTHVPLNLGVIETTDTGSVDWSSLKSSLEPPNVPTGAWNQIYANLTAPLGNTWGQFVTALDNNATYLGSLGENVKDIGALWAFMYLQANDALGPVEHLTTVFDASLPLPAGGDLSFWRNYHLAISGRFASGIMGNGWSVPYQSSISHDANGAIDLNTVGEQSAVFLPDTRGGYFPSDDGTKLMANGDGIYTVLGQGGESDTYAIDGTLAYHVDAQGNRKNFSYNIGGQLIGLTASTGQSITLTYNSAGLVATLTTSQGDVTTYGYDASNQFLLSASSFDGTTTYAYDPATHELTSIQNVDGSYSNLGYDAMGRLLSLSSAEASLTLSYDQPGEITGTDALSNVVREFYNEDGLIVKSIDARGNPTYFSFDAAGSLLKMTDATGDFFGYTYDSHGNLATMTDPLGHTTSFTYGPLGQLTSLRDANNNVTDYAYGASGNPSSITYADGSQESFTFNLLGQPLSYVQRNGQAIGYSYDSSGNVTKETFADGSHYDYAYDGFGNMLTAIDAGGTTSFTYNALGRMTSVSYPGGKSLTFTYNANGGVTRIVDQSGYTTNYAYDSAGRPWKVLDASNNPIAIYTYDAMSRVVRQDNANGTYTTIAYDANGSILHLIHFAPDNSVNSRFDYSYNLPDQMTSMATLDGAWTYSYDAGGQLTRAVFTSVNPAISNQDLAYNYDPVGNRTSTIINGVTTNYTANSMDQYTSVGGILRQYDTNGNLIFDGTSTYTYNQLNQLTGISNAQGTSQFSYNALGQRVASTVNGQITQYLNNPAGFGDVMAEYDGTGQLMTHFNRGLGPVSQTTAAGANYFYDTDQLGSIVGLSNSSGIYADQYSYLPFGSSLSSSGAVANPFQYLGAFGVQADAPDLLGTAAREYAPSTGAFASSDPLQITAGNPNFYNYAFNQPLQLADPSGLNATSGGESWGRRKGVPFPAPTGGVGNPSGSGGGLLGALGAANSDAKQLLGGPLYDTAKEIVQDIVKNHELPSLDKVGDTFVDKSFAKLNVGPFLIGTIEQTLLKPDFAINIVDGINAVRRSNLCGTINAGEAKQLIEMVRPQYLWVVLAVCAARRLEFLRHGSGVQWLGR